MGASKLARSGWLTRQHGAWSMTLVPILVGSALGGFAWWQLGLTVAWLLAFQAFDAFGLWVQCVAPRKGKRGCSTTAATGGKNTPNWARGKRFVAPMAVYGALAALGALALVLHLPALLWYALPVAPLASIAAFEMWHRRPRSFVARASAIFASGLLTLVAFQLGSAPFDWRRAIVATTIITAYFIGTIPYVKTMIRERGNPWWLAFSLTYHASFTLVVLAGALTHVTSWWVLAVWAALTVRAWAFPYASKRLGHPLRPAVFGVSEFVFSAMVVLSLVLT